MATDAQQEFDDVDYVDVGLSIVDTGGAKFRTDGRPPKMSTAIETGILVRYGLVDAIHGKLTSNDDKFCSIFVFDFHFNRLRPSRSVHQVNIDVLVTAEPHAEVSFVSPEERVSINPSTQDVEWVVGGGLHAGHELAGTEAKVDRTTKREELGYATAIGWPSHLPRTLNLEGRRPNCARWVVQQNPVAKDGVPARMRAAVLVMRDDEEEFQLEVFFDIDADWKTRLEKMWGGSPVQRPLIINPKDASTSRVIKTYTQDNLALVDLKDVWQLSYGTLLFVSCFHFSFELCKDLHALSLSGTFLVPKLGSQHGNTLADDLSQPKWLPESLGEGKSLRLLAFSYQRVIDKDIIHTRLGLEVAAQDLLGALVQNRMENPQALVLAAQDQQKYANILHKSLSITHILNVFSEHSDPMEQTFSPFSLTLDVPMEWKLPSPLPLRSLLLSPISEDNISWFLKLFTAPDPEIVSHRRFFQVPPLYPHHDEVGSYDFEWVTRNSVFTEWLNGHDCKLLHIVSDSAISHRSSNPGNLLKTLASKKRAFRRHTFYFRFDKDDARLDNPSAMLTAFFSQAWNTISLSIFPHHKVIEWLKKNKVNAERYSKLPKKHLSLILKEILALFRLENTPITLVIWNLDGCGESLAWVLDFIRDISIFSEAPLRILLESSGSNSVVQTLKKLNAATIKASGEDWVPGYQDLCRREVKKLMRVHPSLSILVEELEKAHARHRRHNALDIPISRWICRQAQSIVAVSDARAVTASLERLSNITTQELLMDMMATIPLHKVQWAKSVLAWLRVSFRPLTTWELEDALSLQTMSNPFSSYAKTSSDFSSELQDCFSGLVTVLDNQVSYVHPMVHHFLTRKERRFKHWYTSPEDAHFKAFETLLKYVCRNQEQSLDSRSTSEERTGSCTGLSRQNLRSYAADFWPSHYLEAKKGNLSTLNSSDLFMAFLDKPSAIRSWVSSLDLPTAEPWSTIPGDSDKELCWKAILTLTIRRSRNALTIEDIDNFCPGWNSRPMLVQAVVREAATSSSAELITSLLSSFKKLPVDTEVLLTSLSVCDNEEIIRRSLKELKSLTKFPDSYVKQAASLGVREIVSLVVQGKVSCNDGRPSSSILEELLEEAILSGKVEMVSMIANALPESGPKVLLSTMNIACQVGRPGSVNRILESGFDMAYFEDVYMDEEPLYTACAYGNWEVVKILTKKSIFSRQDDKKNIFSSLEIAVIRGFIQCTTCVLGQINIRDCSEPERTLLWECLMRGIRNGRLETCRVLLENGVDPNYRETWDDEPVLCTAFDAANNMDLMDLLLKYEVPLEATNSLGNTPLYTASAQGLKDVVAFLIAKGAKVNARANFGGTPLYHACVKNYPEVVKILLDNGADVRISTHEKNWSPLEAAYDYPELILLMVPKNPDYTRVSGGTTALWRAARGGHVESVELLLRGEGIEVDFCAKDYMEDDDGWTPLAAAARAGHATVVRLLLEAGANVSHVNPLTGDFILKLADQEEVVAALLEYAPDLKLTDQEGNTALHIFAMKGQLPPLKRLLNAKADINALNLKGSTPLLLAAYQPLHYACGFASLDMVKLLVRHKADLNAPNLVYGSPLACVCLTEEEQLDKFRYLVEEEHAKLDFPGGRRGPVLNEALFRCNLEVVDYLVKHGGKELLGQADGLGRPPLFYACYRREGALEAVEYLLSQGVVISSDDRDIMGRTVLHCAALAHNVGLIRKLIEINEDLVGATDHHGWTPLHWATRNAYRPDPKGGWIEEEVVKDDLVQTVELLLDGDSQGLSKIGHASERAWTPVKLAKYHGVFDILKDKLAMTPTYKADGGNNKQHTEEEAQLYESPVAVKHTRLCDACFCQLHGIYYTCPSKDCFNNFDLCFKCIEYDKVAGFHDQTHTLLKIGPEYEDAAAHDKPEEETGATAGTSDEQDVSLEPGAVEEILSWDEFIDVNDITEV
ncbi:Ankyrin repeat-containing domain protein [Naviculisporaceae sp. PSN 640]